MLHSQPACLASPPSPAVPRLCLPSALAAGKDRGWGSVWAALTLLGGRASAVYFGALAQRNLIENAMGKVRRNTLLLLVAVLLAWHHACSAIDVGGA